ncbi:hypothetical protein L3X38_018216 [Prunus dulcis]|uniref:Uncharacterized protein n=1 Tax=Prunus dulcis TaxID=3755 RepID=A0AAD4WAD9_PRUDU|nr:hypothetical protein L3X38_018216 [Prunus dulcis]
MDAQPSIFPQKINVGTSKIVASSKTSVEVEFALPIQDTAAITTHETTKATVQTILNKDYADLANKAQQAHLCSSIQSLIDAHFFPTEDESTIKGFMKQLAEGIQAYNQAVMEYNAS